MKIANSVKLTIFAKQEESQEKIKSALLSLIPFDLDQENLQLTQKTAAGFSENKITIFGILLEKDRHIKSFLDNLLQTLSQEVKQLILKQAESRLDKECNFFLRFSKDKLIKENELWLTDRGNCLHIKINIAAFPKKKDIALEIIRKVFKVQE